MFSGQNQGQEFMRFQKNRTISLTTSLFKFKGSTLKTACLFCLTLLFSFGSYGINGPQAVDLLTQEFDEAVLFEKPLLILASGKSSHRRKRQAAEKLAAVSSPWPPESLLLLIRAAGNPYISPDVFSIIEKIVRKQFAANPPGEDIQLEALDLAQKLWRKDTLLTRAIHGGKIPLQSYNILSIVALHLPRQHRRSVALKAARFLSNPKTPPALHDPLLQIIQRGGGLSDSHVLTLLLSALANNKNLSLSHQAQIISFFTTEAALDTAVGDAELFQATQYALFDQLRKNISTYSATKIITVLRRFSERSLNVSFPVDYVDWEQRIQEYLKEVVDNSVQTGKPPLATQDSSKREAEGGPKMTYNQKVKMLSNKERGDLVFVAAGGGMLGGLIAFPVCAVVGACIGYNLDEEAKMIYEGGPLLGLIFGSLAGIVGGSGAGMVLAENAEINRLIKKKTGSCQNKFVNETRGLRPAVE